MKQISMLLMLLFTAPVAYTATAQEDCSTEKDRNIRLACYDNQDAAKKTAHQKGHLGRLSSNKPNFFGFAHPITKGDLEDDRHIELNISIKYPLVETKLENFKKNGPDSWQRTRKIAPNRVFFVYNGRYDFYLFDTGRYTSAPIISRHQNPGVAAEWDLFDGNNSAAIIKRFRFGYFHESNGQTLNDAAKFDAEKNEPKVNVDPIEPKGTEYALAQVSRGWDYLQLRYEQSSKDLELSTEGRWWRYDVEVRYFFDWQGFGSSDREDDIFWELVDKQPKISEYDGLRGVVAYAIPLKGRVGPVDQLLFRGEFKTGVNGFKALKHFGGKLSLGVKAWNTRFSIFYFNGYGKELSTYHLRTQYFGVGLELR